MDVGDIGGHVPAFREGEGTHTPTHTHSKHLNPGLIFTQEGEDEAFLTFSCSLWHSLTGRKGKTENRRA
jgi:hypothetical protein